MTVLISGSSGLIGTTLSDRLRQRGIEVRRLVRRDARYADEYRWDPYGGELDERALKGAHAVVNLNGANIGANRWTAERKRVLCESRVTTTRFLAEQMADTIDPPSVFLSQSAIGIYGDRGDELLDESSGYGPQHDFLASLTVDWEEAATPAAEAGIRVVHPRTGLVLAEDAPLLDRLTPIFRAGLGGPIGSGNQWWSWVDVVDVIGAMTFLLESDLAGSFNVVAPDPVRQKEFAEVMADVMNRPSAIPVPSFAMKLALGGEKAEAIGLSSTRAKPQRLLDAGYSFQETDLKTSLERILRD
jgi:uncharacterized protein (TIGR01777 family)